MLKAIQSGRFSFSDFLDLIDPKIYGTGITLTNNEIKDVMKVIKSLENRGILLKGTTTKITSQEGGFNNFISPLMTAGLPLMKSVLTPLAKGVLISLELSAGISAADAAVQKKIYGLGTAAFMILNEVKSLEESGLKIKRISETIKNEEKKQKG